MLYSVLSVSITHYHFTHQSLHREESKTVSVLSSLTTPKCQTWWHLEETKRAQHPLDHFESNINEHTFKFVETEATLDDWNHTGELDAGAGSCDIIWYLNHHHKIHFLQYRGSCVGWGECGVKVSLNKWPSGSLPDPLQRSGSPRSWHSDCGGWHAASYLLSHRQPVELKLLWLQRLNPIGALSFSTWWTTSASPWWSPGCARNGRLFKIKKKFLPQSTKVCLYYNSMCGGYNDASQSQTGPCRLVPPEAQLSDWWWRAFMKKAQSSRLREGCAQSGGGWTNARADWKTLTLENLPLVESQVGKVVWGPAPELCKRSEQHQVEHHYIHVHPKTGRRACTQTKERH